MGGARLERAAISLPVDPFLQGCVHPRSAVLLAFGCELPYWIFPHHHSGDCSWQYGLPIAPVRVRVPTPQPPSLLLDVDNHNCGIQDAAALVGFLAFILDLCLEVVPAAQGLTM